MQPIQFTRQDLEQLLRETEQAHGEYERTLGHRDENWPAWYADYMYGRLPLANDFAGEPERLPSTEPYLSE
jgi:hypothetical protein